MKFPFVQWNISAFPQNLVSLTPSLLLLCYYVQKLLLTTTLPVTVSFHLMPSFGQNFYFGHNLRLKRFFSAALMTPCCNYIFRQHKWLPHVAILDKLIGQACDFQSHTFPNYFSRGLVCSISVLLQKTFYLWSHFCHHHLTPVTHAPWLPPVLHLSHVILQRGFRW